MILTPSRQNPLPSSNSQTNWCRLPYTFVFEGTGDDGTISLLPGHHHCCWHRVQCPWSHLYKYPPSLLDACLAGTVIYISPCSGVLEVVVVSVSPCNAAIVTAINFSICCILFLIAFAFYLFSSWALYCMHVLELLYNIHSQFISTDMMHSTKNFNHQNVK